MIISKLEKHFGLGKEDAEEYFDKYAKQRTDFSFTNPITGTMKKTLHKVTPQSNMLAKKAKKEIMQTGTTKIMCPMCGQAPKLTTTSKGERTMVTYECGYVYDCEINF